MDKKSEKIEVRVSHSEKRTLRARAAREGLSVSEYIRRTLKLNRVDKPENLYADLARRHPRKVTGGFACMIAGFTIGTVVFPIATAQTHKLEITGAFAGEADFTRYKTAFENQLKLSPDKPAKLSIDMGRGIDVAYEIEIELVPETATTNTLAFKIFEMSKADRKLVTEPRITVLDGQAAGIKLGGVYPDGTAYNVIDIETVITDAN